jgi:hypothetical protein
MQWSISIVIRRLAIIILGVLVYLFQYFNVKKNFMMLVHLSSIESILLELILYPYINSSVRSECARFTQLFNQLVYEDLSVYLYQTAV